MHRVLGAYFVVERRTGVVAASRNPLWTVALIDSGMPHCFAEDKSTDMVLFRAFCRSACHYVPRGLEKDINREVR
jgi:hypothetical protein